MTAATDAPAGGDVLPTARDSKPDAARPVRSPTPPHAVRAAVWALVAVQVSLVTWAVFSGWFYADDFALRAIGADAAWLDPAVVLQNWDGHFMPAGFVIAQILGKTVGFGYLAYAATVALGQAVVAVLFARLLLRHFGERWRILVPLAIYLASIPVLQASVWWASALNALPFLACLVVAADRTLRLVRRPGVGDQIWIVGTAAAALLFFEKAVLLPVMVAMLLLSTTAGPRGGLSVPEVLRRWRWLLAALAVVGAGWLVAYRASGPGTFLGAPDWGLLPEQVRAGLMGTFASSLVGGPWAWQEAGTAYSVVPVPETLGLLVSGAVLVLGGFALTWGPRARGALLMVAVHSAAGLVLISLGRSVFLLLTVALPRYYADLSVVTAIGAALALMRLRDDPAPSMLDEWRPRLTRARVAVLLVGTQALLVSWAIAATSLQGQLPDQRAKDWTREAVASFASSKNAQNRSPVLDSTVPFDVMTPLLTPQNRYSWFFTGIAGAPTTSSSTDDLRMFWPDGALGPGHVEGPRSLPGPAPGCGWPVTDDGRWVAMQNEIVLFDHAMRIQYLAGADTELVVEMNRGDPVTVQLRKGLGDVYLQFVGGGTSVKLTPTSDGAAVCVDRITIGRLVPGPAPEAP